MGDQPIGLRAKAMRHDVTLGGAKYLYSVQVQHGGAPFEKTWKVARLREMSGGVEARGRATWRSVALAVGSL